MNKYFIVEILWGE